MASVHDVAAYILERSGAMTSFRLQKLVYFCQAWSLAQRHEPLFDDPIEAWANGPVSPALFASHKGRLFVSSTQLGQASNLESGQRAYIDDVLAFYGQFDDGELVQMSHEDQPWQDARVGIPAGQRGQGLITHEAMAAYYQTQLAELREALAAAAATPAPVVDGWVPADEFFADLGV